MIEITPSTFDRLHLIEKLDLTEAFVPEARTYQVQDSGGHRSVQDLVAKIFAASFGKSGGSAWDTSRWNTREGDQWATAAHGKGGTEAAVDNAARIANLQLNWLIGEQSQHLFFPRIVEVGEIDGMPYLLRERQPQSLAALARARVAPNGAMLYQLISGIWTALCFLHQPDLNIPHGNLKLSNVLFGPGPLTEAKILLTDAVETQETERKRMKQEDFRSLGSILYQFACTSPGPISNVDALVRADSADWSGLGKEGDAWKELAIRLLDESTYASFNAAAARQEWLDGFRPKKSKFIAVPPPAHAPPAGPTVGGEAKAKPASEVCAEIDAIIESGKLTLALSTATKALVKQEGPSPEILSRIDYCVVGISADEILMTEVLSLLEEAANLGSVPATSRLGLALVKIEPDEAYTWLEKAASLGDVEAIPPLARLYEDGTPQHPANPTNAVAMMNQWREIQPDVNTDYLYAAMILRGKIGIPGTEALALLESCHERGHYRSTDLLAQCHATGIASPIDEKRASNLFAEAWNRSKAANQEYHTASNNLGVCFATGFGVSKDMEKAKHYFRQGALAKHPPSEENLSRLTQASNARL